MSQPVGLNFKSRIPELQDDASIEEALRVYHYGVDNYTTQEIPNDSIEGNFRTLTNRVAATETNSITKTPSSSSTNVIESQSASVTPIAIKGSAGQTSNLQNWQDSSDTNVAVVFSNGASSFDGYVTIGATTQSTTTALDVRIDSASHKGITVKAAPSQTSNIQEWQNSSGTAVSWIASNGAVYSRGEEVSTDPNQGIGSFFLMGG